MRDVLQRAQSHKPGVVDQHVDTTVDGDGFLRFGVEHGLRGGDVQLQDGCAGGF